MLETTKRPRGSLQGEEEEEEEEEEEDRRGRKPCPSICKFVTWHSKQAHSTVQASFMLAVK
eukprot:SAG31_NODE_3119_length_4656_cov_3.057055_2_plen_61_part_00